MNPSIFREYDIRGIADKDLPDSLVYDLGAALGTLLQESKGSRYAVGRDSRLSSPRIASALMEGLLSTGVTVIDIGLVPTPLLYFATFELKVDGGVMVTGSHNPAEHNGFKICFGTSTIHGETVQQIKALMQSRRFKKGTGSLENTDLRARYIEKISSGLKHPLDINVVIDSGNGTAGVVAPELYRALGCKVTSMFEEPDGRFPNHHPDPTLPECLELLRNEVARVGARVGIGFDGDSDRIGVVDQSGRVLFGDELLVLFARQVLKERPGATVISEVKASHRLYQDIAKHGGKPVQWKTGHSLIKAKMRESGALLAGEMSGHIFFKDRFYGFDDAIYAGARLLEILAQTGKTASELLADLPESFATPEIRIDCPDETKFQVVARAKERLRGLGLNVNDIDGARVEFGDGWGLVRASNTQPVLVYRFEASSAKRLAEIRQTVEDVVAQCLAAS